MNYEGNAVAAMDRKPGQIDVISENVSGSVERVNQCVRRLSQVADVMFGANPSAVDGEKMAESNGTIHSLHEKLSDLQSALTALENQVERIETL